MLLLAQNQINPGAVLIGLVVICAIEALFVGPATRIVAKLNISFVDALKPVSLANAIALAIGYVVISNGGGRGAAVLALLVANFVLGAFLYGRMIEYPATIDDSRSGPIGMAKGAMVWGAAALLKIGVVLLLVMLIKALGG